MSLSEKIALVTGASRGIGKAIALTLAREGVTVIGTATTEKGVESISNYLEEVSAKGEGFLLDVTEQSSVDVLLNHIGDAWEAPSILVNNAAITKDNLFLRMDEDEWEKVIATNLTSVYRLTKACIRSMFRARFGRIVNISSIVGATGNTGQANYAAAKAGLVGFSKSVAQEVASRGITVNIVSPGFIDTDMTQALPDMTKEAILKNIPMKRLGRPEDVANAVSFLVSESANYITGETIHVNGGMYMA